MLSYQHKLAELVKSRRKELRIRQEDLSRVSKTALRTIRDLEKGIGNPSLETISKVIDVLGIEMIFRLKE